MKKFAKIAKKILTILLKYFVCRLQVLKSFLLAGICKGNESILYYITLMLGMMHCFFF